MNQFLRLPDSVNISIMNYLNVGELKSISVTCKQHSTIAQETARGILTTVKSSFSTLLPSLDKSFYLSQAVRGNYLNDLESLSTSVVLAIGGAFNGTDVLAFHPSSGRWGRRSSTRRERERSCVAVLDGCVVVISGESDDALTSVEAYNVLADSWSPCEPLPCPIRHSAAVRFGDAVLVMGGFDTNRMQPTSDIHVFCCRGNRKDSVNNDDSHYWSWSTLNNALRVPRSECGAAVFQGEVWVVGGVVADDNSIAPSSSVETITLEADDSGRGWGSASSEDRPSMVATRRGCHLIAVDQQTLLAVGGDEECSIEAFNPEVDRWEHMSYLPTYRRNFSATVVGRKLYIFGGQSIRRQFLSTVDVLDLDSLVWTALRAEDGSDSLVHAALCNEQPGFACGQVVALGNDCLSRSYRVF